MANRYGDTLAAQLIRIAAEGDVVTLDAASMAILGRIDDQDGRNRIACAVGGLVAKGKLRRAGRGRFVISETYRETLPEDDGAAPAPRPVGAAIAHRLNRMALRLNELHEEVSELRHDLRVAERYEEPRPSFPMRCAEWEREP